MSKNYKFNKAKAVLLATTLLVASIENVIAMEEDEGATFKVVACGFKGPLGILAGGIGVEYKTGKKITPAQAEPQNIAGTNHQPRPPARPNENNHHRPKSKTQGSSQFLGGSKDSSSSDNQINMAKRWKQVQSECGTKSKAQSSQQQAVIPPSSPKKARSHEINNNNNYRSEPTILMGEGLDLQQTILQSYQSKKDKEDFDYLKTLAISVYDK